jgi:pyrroline-5-carboxylate reductase
MLSNKTLAFIGSGTMAEAMIKGLVREDLIDAKRMMASGPREARGEQLANRYGVKHTTDNCEAVHDRDVVILAVKPQVMPGVLEELSGSITTGALVLSIAAGVPIQMIADGLNHDAVVRAMPNTPAQIGEGITVWTSTETVSEDQLGQTESILGALGETVHVDRETYLDMATALSGTGPAYVLLFMEAMIDAGVHLGFSRRIAERLVLQTMQGTIEYARQSPRHPATLRNEVTSPGGTSAEALYQLEKGGLRTVVSRAVWAAYQRSLQLGAGNAAKSAPEDRNGTS